MAQQVKKKAARPAKRSTAARAGIKAAGENGQDTPDELSQRLAKVELERDDALRQLADANEQIRQLEGVQEQVVNRIDWVVDSLHTLKSDTP